MRAVGRSVVGFLGDVGKKDWIRLRKKTELFSLARPTAKKSHRPKRTSVNRQCQVAGARSVEHAVQKTFAVLMQGEGRAMTMSAYM
jgi:hypothetical protein